MVVCPVKSLFLNKHVEIMILNYSQNFLFLDMAVYDKRWQRKLNMVTPVLKAPPPPSPFYTSDVSMNPVTHLICRF